MARISIDGVWRETLAQTQAHFGAFATLTAAFVFLPGLLLGAFAPAIQPVQQFTPGTLPHFPPWLLPLFLLLLVLQSIATLTIVAIAGDEARPAHETVGATLARVLPGVLRYLGALIVLMLLYLALLVPFAFVLVAVFGGLAAAGVHFDPAHPGPAAAIAFALIVPLLLWVMARLSPLPGVFAVERPGPIRGIRRSWVLSNGAGWRIAALIAIASLAIILVLLVTQGLAAALGVAATFAGGFSLGSGLALIVSAVLNGLVSILFTVALGVIYRRLRIDQPV